jgi:hypothetical protein
MLLDYALRPYNDMPFDRSNPRQVHAATLAGVSSLIAFREIRSQPVPRPSRVDRVRRTRVRLFSSADALEQDASRTAHGPRSPLAAPGAVRVWSRRSGSPPQIHGREAANARGHRRQPEATILRMTWVERERTQHLSNPNRPWAPGGAALRPTRAVAGVRSRQTRVLCARGKALGSRHIRGCSRSAGVGGRFRFCTRRTDAAYPRRIRSPAGDDGPIPNARPRPIARPKRCLGIACSARRIPHHDGGDGS